jgi:hypothetical protein
MDQFLIGNILLRIDYAGIPVISEGNLRRFLYEGSWEGDSITLECVPEAISPYLYSPLIKDNLVYGVYRHQDQICLVYRWGNQFNGFVVWPGKFRVSFDPRMYAQPSLREDWFFSICSFHRQLLIRNACVLHASYVDIGGEALLFSGPSGMGKSTQAALWTEYAGAQIINGDRAVLRKSEGRWTAFGYPGCGTSGICRNRTLPLRAIVILSKDPENWIEEIPASYRIRALVSAIEQYPWDRDEFDMALDIASEIAAQVPVLKLHCTPDKDAVAVLKHYLEGNANHGII